MAKLSLDYLAGLMDGEGSILIIQDVLHLKITMTNHEVLARVQASFGGRVYGPYQHKGIIHHKKHWEWREIGSDAYQLLKKLAPLLIVKSKQAECALEFGHYMYIWNKRKPRNQYNPITEEEHAVRWIWELALMAYKREN